MNLIGDPWVPVSASNGSTELVGLRALYERAHDIHDLALNPPQRIALMRLLLCVTQAALDGPQDEKDWSHSRERIVPETLAYLGERGDLFNLFGDRPFLQVKDLEPKRNATLDKLDFGLSSGNNPTLFDQNASKEGRDHPPSWAALMLLTYQCFSPGGLIGVTTWAGKKTGQGTSEHAPAIESSPLHTLLRGSTLLESIHLNLLTRAQVATLPGGNWGAPVWDSFPPERNCRRSGELSQSYLGRLVPLSRAILLEPDRLTLTLANGISYPKLPASRETTATVIAGKKDGASNLRYLSIQLSRHAWRQIGSLLTLKRRSDEGGALALDHLKSAGDGVIDLWVGGLAADRGKLLDIAEWTFTLPLELLNEPLLALYEQGVQLARAGDGLLRQAVTEYCNYLKAEASGARDKASTLYWTAMDQRYESLIETASQGRDLDEWTKLVFRQVHNVYAQTCSNTTPRQMQAFALGRRALRKKRHTISPE